MQNLRSIGLFGIIDFMSSTSANFQMILPLPLVSIDFYFYFLEKAHCSSGGATKLKNSELQK